MATQQIPIIFVIGCPASGKGTLCKRLAGEHPAHHISVGDLLRKIKSSETHPQAAALAEAIENQDLLGTDILFPILRDALKEVRDGPGGEDVKAVLLDGFPRMQSQMLEFEKEIAKAALILSFKCPKDIAKKRYLNRGRGADDEAMFEKRFKEFEAEKITHKAFTVIEVDTSGATKDSYDELSSLLAVNEDWELILRPEEVDESYFPRK